MTTELATTETAYVILLALDYQGRSHARTDVWYLVRNRASRMAGHSNAKTAGVYDRRNEDVSVGEVERIK